MSSWLASLGFYVLSCGVRTLLLVAACGILYGAGLLIGRLTDGFAARKKELAKEDRKSIEKSSDTAKKVPSVFLCAVLLVLLMLLGTKYFNFFGAIGNDISAFFRDGSTDPCAEDRSCHWGSPITL